MAAAGRPNPARTHSQPPAGKRGVAVVRRRTLHQLLLASILRIPAVAPVWMLIRLPIRIIGVVHLLPARDVSTAFFSFTVDYTS